MRITVAIVKIENVFKAILAVVCAWGCTLTVLIQARNNFCEDLFSVEVKEARTSKQATF